MSQEWHKKESRMSHEWVTTDTQSKKWMSHEWVTNDMRTNHEWVTPDVRKDHTIQNAGEECIYQYKYVYVSSYVHMQIYIYIRKYTPDTYAKTRGFTR